MIDCSVTQSSTEGEYRFIVIDNGIGMEDSQIPSLCGGLFKTSKRFSQTSFNGTTGTIGKYGVGIKAILLYYNTEITVSSSTLSESSIATYQLGFEGSSIRVRNKKQTAKPTPLRNTLSGTRITVNHIRGNGALAYAFLTSYLTHLFLLNPPFHLHLSFDSFPPLDFGKETPTLSPSLREPLLDVLPALFPAGESFPRYSSHQEEDVFSLDCFLFVLPPSTRSLRSTGENSCEDRLSMFLLSFGNSKPLFSQSRECGLVAAVLHYPHWSSYGMKLRFRGQAEDRFVTLLDCGVEAKEREGLALVVHLRSSAPIPFTSLTKHSVQPSRTIDLLMKRCLEDVLPRLRERNPLQYVSRASQKRLLVYRDTIPSVANSVTNILALMEPETRRRCLALLHWEEKSLEQVEGEMISRMNAILQDTINRKRQKQWSVC
ncbi:hypothetical protein WA556_003468 [Blastocystis sp. ATCC 50177/Nand II]